MQYLLFIITSDTVVDCFFAWLHIPLCGTTFSCQTDWAWVYRDDGRLGTQFYNFGVNSFVGRIPQSKTISWYFDRNGVSNTQ